MIRGLRDDVMLIDGSNEIKYRYNL